MEDTVRIPEAEGGEREAAIEKLAGRIAQEVREDLSGDKMVWPSVPAVVVRIRKVMDQPDVSAEAVTEAIATDPAVATRLVRVANSVYYGMGNPCRDLRSAVVRLGNDALQQVVLLVAVARVFSVGRRREVQPHLEKLWCHSTLVAALCDLFAEHGDGTTRDVALLAGLVHDVGTIPVVVHAQRYRGVLGNANLLSALVSRLHTSLGAAMLSTWHFAPEIVAAAAEHENLYRQRTGGADLTDVVLVANAVAKLGERLEQAQPALARLPATQRLGVNAGDFPKLRELALERCASLRQTLATGAPTG